jgi:hypothetical protein
MQTARCSGAFSVSIERVECPSAAVGYAGPHKPGGGEKPQAGQATFGRPFASHRYTPIRFVNGDQSRLRFTPGWIGTATIGCFNSSINESKLAAI